MDIIYCFGDSFSYRTPPRDYEKFPIEEANQKAQGKTIKELRSKKKTNYTSELLLSLNAGETIKKHLSTSFVYLSAYLSYQ
jgi:hypothetical protein